MASGEIRIVAVNGMLGYGYPLESLRAGAASDPHAFVVDAGSTDAGPYYLGSGESLTKPLQVLRDLRHAVLAARQVRVPLIIGSAGFGGGRPHVDATLGILRRICEEEGLSLRCAVIQAEIDTAHVLEAFHRGTISPMPGAPELDEEHIVSSSRIVGQMGTDPLIRALRLEPDVIVAGRACDAALYAALPLLHGFDPGPAFHMAKIMECGAQCAIPLAPSDCLLGVIDPDGFILRPLNPDRVCTPASVAAHSLYEQPDPFRIVEPEGEVDLSFAQYEQIDPATVRVTGSRFTPSPPPLRIKLEGARRRGYRAVAVAGARDPAVIRSLDSIAARAELTARAHLADHLVDSQYQIRFLFYGRDAIGGQLEPARGSEPHEVGVVIDVVGDTPEIAQDVLALVRASTLHAPFDGRKTTAGNLAVPFSPSDFVGDAVYEFSLYHLMEADDMEALFPVEIVDMGN
jgi:hypothetical protein